MEITQLIYFMHAAQRENFSHAAQEFRVPTSSVSASVKKLENELGIKLFDRLANKITLNEYGKIFLKALKDSEQIMKKARADMLNLSQTPFGEIKLLILTNRQKVTEAISQFKLKYPGISFCIKHQSISDYPGFGDCDIVVSDKNISSELFDRRLWIHEEVMLAMHKSNPVSVKSCVTEGDIVNEKFIAMPKGSSIRDFTDRFFEKANCRPDIAIECDDPHYLRRYVEMGLGVTFFPTVSWSSQINSGIILAKINKGIYRDTYIYTGKNSSDIVKLFAMELEKITE